MNINDPIADLLTRIRNATNARHESVKIPLSKMSESLLKLLKQEGYISSFSKEEAKPQSWLVVFLKYRSKTTSQISQLNRVSRPGRRVYMGYRDLKPFLKGMGLRILSTPKGVITDKAAKKEKVGGEVLCEVC